MSKNGRSSLLRISTSSDAWSTEDVTLIHVREGWQGDFLLAGAYHTVLPALSGCGHLLLDQPSLAHSRSVTAARPPQHALAGFRHAHSFIRIRLQTKEVITPARRAAMPSGRSG